MIKEKGGDGGCQAKATEILTRAVLGCGTKELYEQTGVSRNQRETLPERAQETLMVGEVVATHDLKPQSISGNQEHKNEQIIDSVRSSGQKTRKLFP
jgi:hypothetical protein